MENMNEAMSAMEFDEVVDIGGEAVKNSGSGLTTAQAIGVGVLVTLAAEAAAYGIKKGVKWLKKRKAAKLEAENVEVVDMTDGSVTSTHHAQVKSKDR